MLCVYVTWTGDLISWVTFWLSSWAFGCRSTEEEEAARFPMGLWWMDVGRGGFIRGWICFPSSVSPKDSLLSFQWRKSRLSKPQSYCDRCASYLESSTERGGTVCCSFSKFLLFSTKIIKLSLTEECWILKLFRVTHYTTHSPYDATWQ